MRPLLQINDLSMHYTTSSEKTTYAVSDVSLSIAPSETVVLVGESGSGKTALVRTLIQLLPKGRSHITSGRILYRGTDLLKLSEKELRRYRGHEIGMIFQDPMTSLNPTMRVGHQIIEGLLQHKPQITKERARILALNLLHEIGIPEPEARYEQYPHELSGGMRQRVSIAIATIMSPKLLIADEITTALDVTIQAQILKLLRELKEKKEMALFMITHDLSLALHFADRIVVMYGGRIVEVAPAKELFEFPKHPYTQMLLESLPKGHELLKTIPGSPPSLKKPIQGCPFAPRCPRADTRCQVETPLLTEGVACHYANEGALL